MKHIFHILFIVLCSSAVLSASEFSQRGSECKTAVLAQLSENPDLRNVEQLGELYHRVHYRCIWDLEDIGQLITAASDRRLNYNKSAYHTKILRQLVADVNGSALSLRKRAQLDLLASDQFLSFAKELYEGKIDWHTFSKIIKEDEEKHLVWEPNPYQPDYLHDLLISLKTHLVGALLKQYVPQEKGYRDLVEAYLRYETKQFPKIDYVKDLKEGDYGYEVSQLKHYLFATGDLQNVSRSYLDFPNFDAKLKTAVLRFQKRHYLKQTGIFDRVNVLYSQTTAKEKLAKIRLNIERYKLFPRIHEDTYVEINIPGFWLRFYKQGVLIDDIFVVIGREDRPTPIFSDYLEYIVLNPTWSIPQNLMKKDYIPMLAENPQSLLEDDIHIYRGGGEIDPRRVDWSKYLDYEGKIPYQMVQKAGEKNVLGAMKFIFPNKYNVYLHDTNAKHLTTRRYRLYSSGCIRLAQPYVLLSLLAPYTAYDYETMTEMIRSGKTVHIRLKKRIPIHIRYLTVFTDKEGNVHFRKDFYGYDAIQQKLLK